MQNSEDYLSQKSPHSLLHSFWRAWIKPNVTTYREEVSNASWTRIWLSLAIAIIFNIGIEFVSGSLVSREVTIAVATGLLVVPIVFFASALVFYGLSKLFGGRGPTGRFAPDFMLHSYLFVLIFTPPTS